MSGTKTREASIYISYPVPIHIFSIVVHFTATKPVLNFVGITQVKYRFTEETAIYESLHSFNFEQFVTVSRHSAYIDARSRKCFKVAYIGLVKFDITVTMRIGGR
jgi:hypothetical protein